jgi:hypothetical protein
VTPPHRELPQRGLVVELDGRPRRIADPRARPIDRLAAVTPVPLAPTLLVGLAQLDGEVLPVLRPCEDTLTRILVHTVLGRVILECGRVLPDHTAGIEPLDVDALVDGLRHKVRG